VVGYLYKKFGVELPSLLDGMFAFVLWSHEEGTVLAARDHMGICPLYIGYGHDGSVWFASEMKCFVNEPRIARYEIFPPGHYYHGGPGTVNGFVRWYAPSWLDIDVIPTKPADLTVIRNTLIESVVKRLMADVPYGVLLSGGLDSSLVTAIAVRHGKQATNAVSACPRYGYRGPPARADMRAISRLERQGAQLQHRHQGRARPGGCAQGCLLPGHGAPRVYLHAAGGTGRAAQRHLAPRVLRAGSRQRAHVPAVAQDQGDGRQDGALR
jgi:hypothetical protein